MTWAVKYILMMTILATYVTAPSRARCGCLL